MNSVETKLDKARVAETIALLLAICNNTKLHKRRGKVLLRNLHTAITASHSNAGCASPAPDLSFRN